MKQAKNKLKFVQDSVIRGILSEIIDEIERIKSIEPVNENTKTIARAINKITGKLK
ncbi:hypothetical protein [Sulfurimonas sp.]|uniref:hypothetical protein n=1 Tax=Sulfurimonas sp. TaxID=2022749 RepID=UPI00356600D5